MGLGAEISNDLMRSLRIGEDDISGSGNLKTAASMTLYPLMVERAAPLLLRQSKERTTYDGSPYTTSYMFPIWPGNLSTWTIFY